MRARVLQIFDLLQAALLVLEVSVFHDFINGRSLSHESVKSFANQSDAIGGFYYVILLAGRRNFLDVNLTLQRIINLRQVITVVGSVLDAQLDFGLVQVLQRPNVL